MKPFVEKSGDTASLLLIATSVQLQHCGFKIVGALFNFPCYYKMTAFDMLGLVIQAAFLSDEQH